jgi:integrase/recombinase XerD
MRKYRLQKSIPLTEWPTEDQRRWAAAFGRQGRRQAPGPANGWSPYTTQTVLSSYSCGLGWQQDVGILDWHLPPSQRWPEQVIETYLEHLKVTYAPKTVHSRISGLERALAILEPAADRGLVLEALHRLGKPSRNPEKQRHIQPSDELLQLGTDIMESAEAGEHRSPRLIAQKYRSGLQIALLSLRFWRIGDFMLLRFGVHIVRRDDHWSMDATKPDTRTKKRMRRGRIPTRLVPYLERYLELYRPLLCDGRYHGDALWVSTRARPQSETSFRDNVTKLTGERFDYHVPPQHFRHSAATTMAIVNPIAIDAVSRQMGHTGPQTLDENYNLACSYSASAQWGKTWTALLANAHDRRRLRRRK